MRFKKVTNDKKKINFLLKEKTLMEQGYRQWFLVFFFQKKKNILTVKHLTVSGGLATQIREISVT